MRSRIGLVISTGLAGLLLLGCASGGAAASGPTAPSPTPDLPSKAATREPKPPEADCPKLESRLNQLRTARDPAEYAARHGVEYANGRVEVEVTFANPGEQGDLAQPYGLQVLDRSRSFLNARAPLMTLCDLAQDPRVRTVRPLVNTIPGQTSPTPSPPRN